MKKGEKAALLPCPLTWEIIIVNDGSSDKTKEKALEYVEKYGSNRIRLLSYDVNQGKGYAVKQVASPFFLFFFFARICVGYCLAYHFQEWVGLDPLFFRPFKFSFSLL